MLQTFKRCFRKPKHTIRLIGFGEGRYLQRTAVNTQFVWQCV